MGLPFTTNPMAGRVSKAPAPRDHVVIGRVVLAVAVMLVPVLYSYTIALTGPGSDSAQARTVEWARDHHFGPVVDQFK